MAEEKGGGDSSTLFHQFPPRTEFRLRVQAGSLGRLARFRAHCLTQLGQKGQKEQHSQEHARVRAQFEQNWL